MKNALPFELKGVARSERDRIPETRGRKKNGHVECMCFFKLGRIVRKVPRVNGERETERGEQRHAERIEFIQYEGSFTSMMVFRCVRIFLLFFVVSEL